MSSSSLEPPEGITAEQWALSKFGTGLSAFVKFSTEYAALQAQSEQQMYSDNKPSLLRVAGPNGKVFSNRAYSINGYKGIRYIASHEPNHKSVEDFWLMVDQEGVMVIVMLNGYEVLHDAMHEIIQYWPISDGEQKEWGACKVVCVWSKCKQSEADKASHSATDADQTVFRVSKLTLTGP